MEMEVEVEGTTLDKVMDRAISRQDKIVKFVMETGLCFECKEEKVREKGAIRCPGCQERDQEMLRTATRRS